MNNRERTNAILHYQPYDRMPVVHFGYWGETLQKWAAEGHISHDDAKQCLDGNHIDAKLDRIIGWDFNWHTLFWTNTNVNPTFQTEVLRTLPDGSRHVRQWHGVVLLDVPGTVSIQSEIDHLLKDRASFDEHYRSRLQWSPERITTWFVRTREGELRYDQGGREFLKANRHDWPIGLRCGALLGDFRNIIGVEGLSYLYMDDEPLFREILEIYADLCYRNTEYVLKDVGGVFDFAHFWEDICYKNGPLVIPGVFDEICGPHYKRITDLLLRYGIDIVSLDCDGCIDSLIPTWINNGVNTMFPIEVGTWNASIEPWRHQYGRKLLGVGGMNKVVFAHDRKAIDQEVERLRRLIELGGFIPCPDHRIAPDAKWDLVRHYCDRMHHVFG